MKNANNSSYKIFITSSAEAAHLISSGLSETTPWSMEGGQRLGVESGCVHQDCRIPALYQGDDRFYALIEYRNGENWEHPEYQIVIC